MLFRAATFAMNTRFELVLQGEVEPKLCAAAEEAISEIEACEERLSLFRPGSLLSLINREAAERAVGVDRETFDLLLAARRLHLLTLGAFDPTVAPLMKVWKLHSDKSSAAEAESVEAARRAVGMSFVELDETNLTVRFMKAGVSLDLGGLAKGHALALAERVLREAKVEAALMHAGTSSVTAIGAPDGHEGWKVAVRSAWENAAEAGDAVDEREVGGTPGSGAPDAGTKTGLAATDLVVLLRDRSLSVSAPHGRSVQHEGVQLTHILDPRTGRSAVGASIAAAVCASPTDAEGLSTGLVVLNERPPEIGAECITILPPRECSHAEARPAFDGWRVEGRDADRVVLRRD